MIVSLFDVARPRGDGFPLAAFLAIIAADHRDFVPMMAAHVHTVCPIAIPTLPEPGASENDFMAGLGMIKDKKTGDFETFDRFLTRTEVSGVSIKEGASLWSKLTTFLVCLLVGHYCLGGRDHGFHAAKPCAV